MIEWMRAKTNPVPAAYPVLMLLADGSTKMGIFQPGDPVIAWTVINKPNWYREVEKPRYRRGHEKEPVCGEAHPKAVLSDADIELIFELYKPGVVGYKQLAKKFDCSWSCIRNVIKGRRRGAGVHDVSDAA